MDKAVQSDTKPKTWTEWASDAAYSAYTHTLSGAKYIGAGASGLEPALENILPKASHMLPDWAGGASQAATDLKIGNELPHVLEKKTLPGASGGQFWPDGPNADHIGVIPDFAIRRKMLVDEDLQLHRALEELRKLPKTKN